MTDHNDKVDLSDVEYPDSAGYPDGQGVVGDGPTTESVPSGVDPAIADEPEPEPDSVDAISTDEESIVENDG
jgi:hypothetical protein